MTREERWNKLAEIDNKIKKIYFEIADDNPDFSWDEIYKAAHDNEEYKSLVEQDAKARNSD